MFDEITRFIFYKQKFSAEKNTVKSGAFRPPPDNSVFGITDLSEAQIWEIGTEYVAKILDRELKARGDLDATTVDKTGLRLVPDGIGHPRHAVLEGWPDAKEDQMSVAQELAAGTTLRIIPEVG